MLRLTELDPDELATAVEMLMLSTDALLLAADVLLLVTNELADEVVANELVGATYALVCNDDEGEGDVVLPDDADTNDPCCTLPA